MSRFAPWHDGSPRGLGTVLSADAVRAAADHAARTAYGKLVALLASRGFDLAACEDALADAFAAALATWPTDGVPRMPEAWLLISARRKLIDRARRDRTRMQASDELLRRADADIASPDEAPAIPDQRLALLFACAHPAIEPAARAPLMLQVVLGFDAARIASAFLVAPSTLSQRLVRAKRRLRDAKIAFELPSADQLAPRLDAVAQAIYAAYADGWLENDPDRRAIADEAVWLARVLAVSLPGEAEAQALLALILYADARRDARGVGGVYVPLSAQDTRLWNHALIDEAELLLRRALTSHRLGRFQLEAAIQSAHIARRSTGTVDWTALVQLYDALTLVTGSIVARVNGAVAVARAQDAAAGLVRLDALAADPALRDYQPYWAARAHLLGETGAVDAAREAYLRAIGLSSDPALIEFLRAQMP
ncbi:RNA polymerase sigma factor [Roseiterribacter gracilis]|uniref:DNA-directed RNA polymerase sigma-70 factor n=1 Tax=Roseiterribacter gracilis TaxID=2812848 RepID=A0A8S8XD15_9PROT|nr:DNA-directed RNA polymerase sigma-70 factor [Rhodospirillales bacterium TMPK1]